MSEETVRLEEPGGGVAHVVLQATERRNPIDHRVLDVLEEAVLGGERAAVVLSADPGPAFSAGGDLRLGPAELRRVSDRIYALCRRLADSPTVLVVAADGDAIGGGAHLFVAADLRVAGPSLRFAAAIPGSGLAAAMWLLPAVVGRGRALDLLLSGRRLGAEEALAWGIADRLAEDATATALEWAGELALIPERHRLRVKRGVAETLPWGALAHEQSTFAPPRSAS